MSWWPHRHSMRVLGDVRLELPPGLSHTTVVLLECRCGIGEAFPASKWNLASKEEQERVRVQLHLREIHPVP